MYFDVIILGAGAAGLMAAISASSDKKKVCIVDHAKQIGKKILISGGGKCNFTNLHISTDNYLSDNHHFVKSALSQYTQWDFIQLIEHYQISYHEKKLGQLFCDNSAKDITTMFLDLCQKNQVTLLLRAHIHSVEKKQSKYIISINDTTLTSSTLIVATGGLSLPKLGATPLGYQIAQQFDLKLEAVRAGLVPITLHTKEKILLSKLSGISLNSEVSTKNSPIFKENILFTHRGLSGPAILQASSYITNNESIFINLAYHFNIYDFLLKAKKSYLKQSIITLLSQYYPNKFLHIFFELQQWQNKKIIEISDQQLKHISNTLTCWCISPAGTEGYRTAEVTIGGVHTDMLSSKSMEVKSVNNLYFIGEVVNVTGWLGGYNFQWAWSSGYVAGKHC